MNILKISNLVASARDKVILNGINLEIKTGEVHTIMGLNGAGKSTLVNVIMGNPNYKVIKGSITFNNKDLLSLSVDERARAGIFLAMQNPTEIKGVLNSDFLRAALNARSKKPINIYSFIKEYETKAKEVGISKDLSSRYLNDGYSGGEKKRNEILQLKMLKPKVALIDEIDSGLDVDALKTIGENIQKETKNLAMLIITHYQRLFDYVKPTHVHIISKGKIVYSGGPELIKKIDKEGYEWLEK